jgi:excisionase family DNA binding protein
MEFNVRLEFRLPPDEEHGEQLVDALESFHPAAGPVGNGNLDVWITIQAANVRQAIDTGLALASAASSAELVAFEALPTADFDRREGLTPVPDLISAEEAAEMLGISRQAVHKKVTAGTLPGHRVGERTLVFARTDVEEAAARQKATA